MNKKAAIVGVGVGAALMYLFDPDRGRRRRALIRDKVDAAANKTADYAGKMQRDLRNRAYGIAAETKSLFRNEQVSDDVLVDRVRAKLGRFPVHIGAFDVQANNGVIALSGPILADELPKVLRATRLVRGVKSVDNRLVAHLKPADETTFQGTSAQVGSEALDLH